MLDLPPDDPCVEEAHAAVIADPATRALIERLPDWEVHTPLSGHESPAYAPNLLHLLADRGVQESDDIRIEHLLDQMLLHQAPTGQFMYFGSGRSSPAPGWSWLLCDTHAIVEVLLRFGRGDDARVQAALARMAADLTPTAQGQAWPCIPDPVTGFRGPGRKGDVCPQVTLEALRAFGRLPESCRPEGLHDVARVLLRVWQQRGAEQPYMFGHGLRFKTVKWPTTWYGVANLLDALGRYPSLWRGPQADPVDRQSLAELAACLVAYNFDQSGRVTPGAVYRGFEQFTFGQKKQPSAFATAHLLTILRRFDELTDEIRAVNILTLASSKGGSGSPRPPRAR